MKRTTYFVMWLGSAGLAGFLGGAGILAGVGLTDRGLPADVAIVFGTTVNPDGFPSKGLQARLDRAGDLYQQKLVSAIIVSGDGQGKEGHDEAQVMAQYLHQKGIPDAALHIDNKGYDTYQTCLNAADYLNAQGLHSALVVSKFFHTPRAQMICAALGIKTVGRAHAKYFDLRDVYWLFREVPAYLYYRSHLSPKRLLG